MLKPRGSAGGCGRWRRPACDWASHSDLHLRIGPILRCYARLRGWEKGHREKVCDNGCHVRKIQTVAEKALSRSILRRFLRSANGIPATTSQPVLTIRQDRRQDTLSDEIGTGAVLGEGPEHRVQNNKREIRDGRHNSQCREPFKSQRCLVNSFAFTKSD